MMQPKDETLIESILNSIGLEPISPNDVICRYEIDET